MHRYGLLLLLGFLWAARLSAIKAAGSTGVPVHAIIALSVFGIAVLYTAMALIRQKWPRFDRQTTPFYILSALLGFILPFALESIVAPNLSVFALIVIISTVPVMTVLLAMLLGVERVRLRQVFSVLLGFCVALLIAVDTAGSAADVELSWFWVSLAFGVPVLYALNTLFVVSRWPSGVDAIQVAQAQGVILSAAILVGSLLSGSTGAWIAAASSPVSIVAISVTEAFALLIYLKVARDFGASFVSLANYLSIAFAAAFGAFLFGDEVTWLSGTAVILLIAALWASASPNSN